MLSEIRSLSFNCETGNELRAVCWNLVRLLSLLGLLAPVSTKKPPTPWMTQEIMKAETLRHNPERAWRRSRTDLVANIITTCVIE